MSKHIRYAVKTDKGFARRKGSSYYVIEGFEKADLFLTEHHAKMSAKRHKGIVVKVIVEEIEE